ncbi:MAG: prevent-host-death family protein [Akkermansiaceae bacterium]|jgi:prevent-host-death family protein
MHEAKTHFSKLVRRANEGEEIIVTNRGEPVATIQPIKSKNTKNEGGFFKATRPPCTEKEWQKMNDEMLANFNESGIL